MRSGGQYCNAVPVRNTFPLTTAKRSDGTRLALTLIDLIAFKPLGECARRTSPCGDGP